jgi:tetratricopeptide (TPR) repeat protein
MISATHPRAPRPRLRPGWILACLLSIALSSSASAQSADVEPSDASRAGVEAALQRLGAALTAKTEDAVMACYALSDTAAMKAKRLECEGYLGFDSLACAMHLGRLRTRGDQVEAAVYREIAYQEYQRSQIRAEWLTMTLQPSGDAWRITSETARDVARTRFTTLDVALDPDAGSMSGTAVLRLLVDLPGEDALVLHLNRGLSIVSATDAQGRDLAPRRVADTLILPFSTPLQTGDSTTVRLTYRGTLFNESKELQYSQVSIAPEGSFASWVTSWYPRLPGPKGKSPGRITFDVPAGITVAMTGDLVSRSSSGARERQTFASRVPRSFSFAAAHYAHREETADGIRVGVYFLAGGDAKAARYIPETTRVLRTLRQAYGMYPYDSFDIVEIPKSGALFLGGSSEQGMSLFPTGILPDDSFPLPLISHEMGHSWWGNLIESDQEIIGEGLAQESAVLAIRALRGDGEMRRFLEYGYPAYPQCAERYFTDFAGQEGKDLPIGTERPGTAVRGTLHDLAIVKGHFAYDMLRASIGDRAFLGGLRQILRSHQDTRVTLRDLEEAWETSSRGTQDAFFEQWFYRSGAPEFSFQDTVLAAGAQYQVQGHIDQLREPYQVTAEIVAVLANGVHVERVPVSGPDTPFAFRLGEKPRAVLFDPDYRILRWTSDFKEAPVLDECRRLRSLGKIAEAEAKLDSCIARDQDAARATLERGLCELESGRLDSAAARFGVIARRDRLYPRWNPSLGPALIHLGEIADLQGRREDAIAWYGKAVHLPNDSGIADQARQFLAAPYRTPIPPPADSLARYEGTYAVAGVGEYTIRRNGTGRLCIAGPRAPESGLGWLDGSRFAITARDGYTIEFQTGSDGKVESAVFRGPTFVLAAPRKGP